MKLLVWVLLVSLSLTVHAKDKVKVDKKWLANFTKTHGITTLDTDVKVPKMELKGHTGKILKTKSLKGKVVLLNFFATWCPSCIAELPDFQVYDDKFPKKKFSVVLINAKERAPTVKKFMKRNKYKMEAYFDPSGELIYKFQVSTLPTSFIIDKKGKIRYMIVGAREWKSEEFHKFFTMLMAE